VILRTALARLSTCVLFARPRPVLRAAVAEIAALARARARIEGARSRGGGAADGTAVAR
jgi:hypothetical protein